MKSDDIYSKYAQFLKNVDRESSLFSHFKRDRYFMEILEHVGEATGFEYKTLIENEFHKKIQEYKNISDLNDSIGNPIVYTYDEITMSPTNLRYIYHALLIKSKCDAWFTKKQIKIVEIGGGYGGLALFIKQILRDYEIDYTIVDLPEPSALQHKYLSQVNLSEVKTVSCFDIDTLATEKFDLVISNYCISEISEENKNQYFEKLIKNCDKKFFVWNFLTLESSSFLWKKLKVKKVLALFGVYPPIKYVTKKEYVFEKERPQTGGINAFIYSR
jgi:putative sugar O-methyltransferase